MNNITLFFQSIEFANPYYFLLLLLIIPVAAWQYFFRKRMQAPLTVPTAVAFEKVRKTWKVRLRWLPACLLLLAYVSFIVALSRPQTAFRLSNVEVEGVDIVIAIDISGSMKAMDFRPNRLEACKQVAQEFILGRPTDRIGLVVYAGEAYTQCPVTSDHNTLLGLLQKVRFDIIEDGTAIGDGLGTAINRLRESEAKSKIIILLSDGVNNSGYLDPYSAAEIAKNMGIKVYTIGVGTIGQALFPTPYGNIMMQTEIDERLLETIARESGGKYFRATNNDKLKAIYTEIDKMEKTILNETIFENKADAFFPFLLIGVILLIFYLLLRYTVFRTYP
ncbi:MAG: VWA domain-containing protein [Bacteroidetes bacterium]|nr:VWA domain-containing protein [Bacteroidota bacterium]MCL2301704.1 VWA domain-containing protein [Lentimicrobiaceae bacterium]